MRTIIDYDPFLDLSKFWGERGRWPAKWITHPKADGTAPIVQAFRRTFRIEQARTIRLHVTADERYDLFLDGDRIGRGSERGDRLNWSFETHDLQLSAGEHILVARTWWLGPLAPAAQISVRPAFLLTAEGVEPALMNTGFAPWEAKLLDGYHHVPSRTPFVGPKLRVVGKELAWDFERGDGDEWTSPRELDWAYDANQLIDQPSIPILKPATLPAMLENAIQVGTARHVQKLEGIPEAEVVVPAAEHLPSEAGDWNALLAGQHALVIPPHTVRRVIVDLADYFCAYTDLLTTGGKGAAVHVRWAESLYAADATPKGGMGFREKGNRDAIEGKVFVGDGDTFLPDGGERRHFDTLWWSAGRYLEIIVATADEPLTIEQFSLRETHYPLEWKSKFASDDTRFEPLTPLMRRVIEMCSHETYMDCPYYEQLMYVGDTRLEVLTTYANCSDDRLPLKALRLFDESRKSPGFTQSRYPSRLQQTIPSFSAWWVAMVHDFAMWRDDAAFVRSLLPGVRTTLDAFMRWQTKDGLIAGPAGWNFMDWVPGWANGMPPNADVGGISGPLNFQLAWVFKQAAELEEHFGEHELAQLQQRRSQLIGNAAVNGFWDESRGLFADDVDHKHFSEHSQCLALLGDCVSEPRRPGVVKGLFEDDTLARATIYFSHYLFETCALVGRMDVIFKRLALWFDLPGLGFKTTLEMPEPSRSDCHAWGAHPMFHTYATILGIRPAAPGFKRVRIEPQLGPLSRASGSMVHPRGTIAVEVTQKDGHVAGNIKLPDGVEGELVANGRIQTITGSDWRF